MGSRDEILSKIKAIRKDKNLSIELPKAPAASGLKMPGGELKLTFKASIEAVNGECVFCDDIEACANEIKQFLTENNASTTVFTSSSLPFSLTNAKEIAQASDVSKIEAGISTCDLLAAQTGTVILTAKESRRLLGLSPIHIVIARESQLRSSLDEAVKEISEKYRENMPSQLTLITGPSRTADIEKTLILGAHGPKRLVVFIYKD